MWIKLSSALEATLCEDDTVCQIAHEGDECALENLTKAQLGELIEKLQQLKSEMLPDKSWRKVTDAEKSDPTSFFVTHNGGVLDDFPRWQIEHFVSGKIAVSLHSIEDAAREMSESLWGGDELRERDRFIRQITERYRGMEDKNVLNLFRHESATSMKAREIENEAERDD